MKTQMTFFTIALACSFSITTAQLAPEIEWQNTIGGSASDYFNAVQQTSDGGYILGGGSYSGISGDKTEGNLGDRDYWVVKLDSSGNIVWQNTIGGSGFDWLIAVQQTSDGGYILGGESSSGISGDKIEASLGSGDYWVLKLDGSGNIEWQNTIGGSHNEYFKAVQQTSDGGYILGGYSYSGISGDKTEASMGDYDYWAVKLDDSGNIEWQNTIGGSRQDFLLAVQQTVDGGYILGGYSVSDISGDKTEVSQGSYDYWVVKLDGLGNTQWQNTIGGNGLDYLNAVKQTSDGGYILGGESSSGISGDKTEANLGGYLIDYWVLKLDGSGNILWQNTIGGSSGDHLKDVQQTFDGGYILGGFSYSDISGDKTEAALGASDYWVVKLDDSGNTLWQNTIGGSQFDELSALRQTSDGGFILGGSSNTGISGDKTETNLESDYWVVKLLPVCSSGSLVYLDYDGDTYGNAEETLFVSDCIAPTGYVYYGTDCNDDDATVHALGSFYADTDGDGYGEGLLQSVCYDGVETPDEYSNNNTDCNDNNNAIYPGACDAFNGNSIDDNCDGIADNGFGANTYYADADGDGYGAGVGTSLCSNPGMGYEVNNTDCNSSDSAIYPGAAELFNGFDDDCNGIIDDVAQNIWTQKANFGGGAIAGAVSFSIYDKGYVGAFGSPAFWQYDLLSDTWTQNADFGGGSRSNAVGFCIGSKGYIGTGLNNLSPGYTKDFWEYDPETNTWTQKADFGGGERCCATGFSIGNKGLIGTGIAPGYLELAGDFWEYDPVTDLWTQKAYYGEVYDAVGFSIGNKGYIGGGRDWYDSFGYFAEYDPDADTWTGKAYLGRRTEAVGFSIGNKGYIGLGTNWPTPYEDYHIFNDILEYDPASDTWSKGVIFLGGARFAAFGFSIGTKGYIGTGISANIRVNTYNDFWEFNPVIQALCTVPTGEATVNITGTSAKLKWDIVDEAKRYNIRYRAAGTNEWIILTNIISNSKAISGLIPNTLYFWEVKCICSATPVVSSDWSAKQSFTTGLFRLNDEQTASLDLYPNPVTESFTLDLQPGTTTDHSATIYLLNALGQTVQSSMEVLNGELTKVITMPSSAASGWYVVRVVLRDQVLEQKLLYQK